MTPSNECPSILDFLKTFGINTKTNFDLKDYANYLNLKIKILMNDELSSLESPLEGASNIIINYQDLNEKGSHWVCIYKKSIYFDSFGIKPTKEVEDYLLRGYTFNSLQVQPWNTKICGILSLYVLYRLNRGGEGEASSGIGEGYGRKEDFESIIQEIYDNLESLL